MSRRNDANKDVLSKIHEQTEEGFAECEGHSRAPVFKRARNRALRVAGLQLRYPAEQHDLHI